MPTAVVKSYAEKLGISVDKVEKKWKKAVEEAKKSNSETDKNFYAIVTTIFKKMLNVKEDAPAAPVAEPVASTQTGDVAVYPKRMMVYKRLDDLQSKKMLKEGTILEKLSVILERNQE